ncbi:MAG: hypothetical protein C0482_06035 [Gordonia sp.]|nr:hypothetical protein [Gordonia sp. (in: high G+C Gram-positive bacteria)]
MASQNIHGRRSPARREAKVAVSAGSRPSTTAPADASMVSRANDENSGNPITTPKPEQSSAPRFRREGMVGRTIRR